MSHLQIRHVIPGLTTTSLLISVQVDMEQGTFNLSMQPISDSPCTQEGIGIVIGSQRANNRHGRFQRWYERPSGLARQFCDIVHFSIES